MSTMLATKRTVEQYPPLPVGEYRATLQSITPTTGVYGEQWVWEFQLEGGDNAGRKMRAWTSDKYTFAGAKTSKAARWVKALTGGEPDELFVEDIVGKPCTLVILQRTKDNGDVFNKVEDVKPAPRPATPAGPDTNGMTVAQKKAWLKDQWDIQNDEATTLGMSSADGWEFDIPQGLTMAQVQAAIVGRDEVLEQRRADGIPF